MRNVAVNSMTALHSHQYTYCRYEKEIWKPVQPGVCAVCAVTAELRPQTDRHHQSVRVCVKEAASKWSVLPLNCQASSTY